MDSCQRFKEMISDYIEGGLDQQSNLQMGQHLRDCLKCTQSIKQLKNLIRKLKELPKLTVSPYFNTILRARIGLESSLDRRRRERFFSSWQLRLSAYAATAILVLFALLTIFSQSNKRNQIYPLEAYTNQEWIGGAKQVNPSSNERIIYFIERQPVYNVVPHTPNIVKSYNSSERRIISDSTQINTNEKSWIERTSHFESLIY